MTQTLVVIQARMYGVRLAGQAAFDLLGAPMLERMIERVRAASSPFEICVATSRDSTDDPIVEIARKADVRWYRGRSHDCLHRHLRAALEARADHVVKLSGNCPLIDPDAIDQVLDVYHDAMGDLDYVSNLHPASWPAGNGVEVVPTFRLEQADRLAIRPVERETTTAWFHANPEHFRLGNVRWGRGLDLSRSHRFQVQTMEDFWFVEAVYESLFCQGEPPFSLGDILGLLDRRPHLMGLNRQGRASSNTGRHLDDLDVISSLRI